MIASNSRIINYTSKKDFSCLKEVIFIFYKSVVRKIR